MTCIPETRQDKTGISRKPALGQQWRNIPEPPGPIVGEAGPSVLACILVSPEGHGNWQKFNDPFLAFLGM